MLISYIAGYFSIGYSDFLEIQNRMVSMRQEGKLGDSILHVFHDHVFTGGIRSSPDDIKDTEVNLVRINRGGSVTYHGPGQVNIYPVVDIEKLRLTLKDYMKILQKAVSEVLSDFGLYSQNLLGDHLGTWVDGRKICSYGVAVQKGITSHGLSLNVTTDMRYFSSIRPCGFEPSVMVSMRELLPAPPASEEVSVNLIDKLIEALNIEKYIKISSLNELKTKIEDQ